MNKAMRNEKGQFVKISTYAVDLSYEVDLPYDSKKRRIILIDVENPCAESINKAIDRYVSEKCAKERFKVTFWKMNGITKL